MLIVSYFISWIILAFGEPAWYSFLGPLAATFGFTLFWKQTSIIESSWHRFLIGFLFFSLVQAVQLSWFLSHPYNYIYLVYFLLLILYGIQFGILTWLITAKKIENIGYLFFLSGLWVFFEWSRLYWLTGMSWNPVGIYLVENIFSLQTASIGGIYFLSFLVIFTNLLFLRALNRKLNVNRLVGAFLFALLPYAFGFFQIEKEMKEMSTPNHESDLKILLVQTAFPAEEALSFTSKSERIGFVMDEWKEIATLLASEKNKPIDLIVLPEICVPFGIYTCLYPLYFVEKVMIDTFGKEVVSVKPNLDEYVSKEEKTIKGSQKFVNNLFWAKWLSKVMSSDILMGVEDVEDDGEKKYFSSAILVSLENEAIPRYDKRILVPMAEYIPGESLKGLAAWYGVQASFTPGESAKVFNSKNVPFGVAICYEETFGDLMRENKTKGANLLINLTSDVWFPNSRLPLQHLTHAKVRTVELGVPLVRSCNTGVTAAYDSLGRLINQFGEDPFELQNQRGALYVNLPIHHYETPYSQIGDAGILSLSAFSFLFLAQRKRNKA